MLQSASIFILYLLQAACEIWTCDCSFQLIWKLRCFRLLLSFFVSSQQCNSAAIVWRSLSVSWLLDVKLQQGVRMRKWAVQREKLISFIRKQSPCFYSSDTLPENYFTYLCLLSQLTWSSGSMPPHCKGHFQFEPYLYHHQHFGPTKNRKGLQRNKQRRNRWYKHPRVFKEKNYVDMQGLSSEFELGLVFWIGARS